MRGEIVSNDLRDSESSLDMEANSGLAESVSTSDDVVARQLEKLYETLRRLEDDLRSANDRAALREEVIARLHQENEKLRAGERHLLLRPVQADLQRLRNDLLRQAATLPAEYSAAMAAEMFESFAMSVELALERCGIAVLRPDAGTAFDPARHRAVQVVAAAAAEEDGTIAEVATDGYLDTVLDRVVTPAGVRVRRWDPVAAGPDAVPVTLPLARPRTD
jgi:molecular chaperone GrpE